MTITEKPLDSVADILSGFAWKSSRFTKDRAGKPIIRIQNVGDGGLGELVYWPDAFKDKFLISSGDILLTLSGSFRLAEWNGPQALLNQRIIKIEPNENHINRRYFIQYMQTKLREIERLGRHALVNNVSVTDIRNLSIPLPTLSDQKRIATILDQADALRDKRRAAIAKLDELVQSVFLDMFGDPVTNPKGWPTSPLADLLLSIDSGWSPKCEDWPARTNEWGVLKLGSVTWCNFNPSENKALPTGVEPRPKLEVRPGDLLFTRKNTYELVAASAYVWETQPKLMLPDLVFRLRIRDQEAVSPIFLWQQLVNEHMRKGIQSLAGGAAGSMPNISKAKLKSVQVMVPPIELQQRYVNVIQSYRRESLCMQENLHSLNNLFGSLQQRAFRGDQ